jgi:hypothetical protein
MYFFFVLILLLDRGSGCEMERVVDRSDSQSECAFVSASCCHKYARGKTVVVVFETFDIVGKEITNHVYNYFCCYVCFLARVCLLKL